jgi:hypothetical protein
MTACSWPVAVLIVVCAIRACFLNVEERDCRVHVVMMPQWDEPQVVHRRVLTPDECRRLIEQADGAFHPEVRWSAFKAGPDASRTSQTAWISKDVNPARRKGLLPRSA